MKTYMAKADSIEKKWYVVDAEGRTLGRLASEIAKILMGKNKPEYTPSVDTGDYVIVINADKVVVTGKKETQKLYRRHTGYVGGLREVVYRDLMAKHPDRIITYAVKGMLPKNKLGRHMLKKMKVYAGSEHNHQAQNPIVLDLNE
ncbi:MAG TPA: 50S ribosomal protein L13 [Clostridia bacterium]|nr:50S ribosomal protein L13 [Clostridiaceae bacterium]HOF26596.1 50S ribosomal protein L13 [Clostridia bacterium]HOM34289.1 50S ribosomal protein L13 [Clostridia bacterium]HOR89406.1 50S ribosomal protein L13 [Clostridia bacterium]HOT70785.1 50S ribosomal protein L13 [Clostridia bacterium]